MRWCESFALLGYSSRVAELLPANEKCNFFVSNGNWIIISKSYHFLNLLLFSPKFSFFYMISLNFEYSLQLPVPRSPTFRAFAALCFPTPALFCTTPVFSLIKRTVNLTNCISIMFNFHSSSEVAIVMSYMKAGSNEWFISLHMHCWTVCVSERSVKLSTITFFKNTYSFIYFYLVLNL